MVGILDKFLSFFKKKKQLTLVESLTRLKKKKMDFYSPKFNQEPQSFLENNILDTIAKYKYINQFPIEQSDIQVGSISMFSYKTMNFYQWFTNNGKMIENKDKVLKEWIDESIKLVKLYEFRIKLQGMEDNKSYVNAKRIAPYYYDLERLVEKLNTLT